MAIDTTPITDAADDLANSLTEGAEAVDQLSQGIVNAIVELDRRLSAVEEGGSTAPPIGGGGGEGEGEGEGDASGIPMSFNDPIFSGMTEKTSTLTLNSGQNLTKTSIKEQSGNPSITCNGNNHITTCRVQSRECVRITDGDLTIENSYLEAKGTGDDHADTLQAYSPHTRGASVTLRNTHVRAYTEAATAGYFSADYWGGEITCENVIFQGGPFGFRVHSDTDAHIDLYMEDVFFVGPFGYEPFLLGEYGGTITIHKWENVRNATIVDGKLVPGNVINQPNSATMAQMAAKAPPVPERKKK
jgi:hypothetical protein